MRQFLLIILIISFFNSSGQSPLRLLTRKVSVGATIAFVSSADGGNNGGSTSSLTYAFTTSGGSNRFLVIAVVGDVTSGNDDISSVTYNSVGATFIAKTSTSSSGRFTYLYYLANPTTGANNVVVTAGSTHFLLSGVSEYTGVGGLDNNTTNSGTGTSLTTSITPNVNNCWAIVLESGFNSSNPPGAGTGSTRRTYDAAFGTWGLFDNNAAINPAASTSMQTTRTSSCNIDHIMISIKPY